VKKQIYELGLYNFGKRWYIVLLGDDDNTHFHVVEDVNITIEEILAPNTSSITKSSAFSIHSNTMEIDDIRISPKCYQKRGIGHLVVMFMEKTAKLKGVKTIRGYISKYDDFNELIKFYKNLGFAYTPYNTGSYIGYCQKVIS
jgi:hypothetical protein